MAYHRTKDNKHRNTKAKSGERAKGKSDTEDGVLGRITPWLIWAGLAAVMAICIKKIKNSDIWW